MRTSEKALRRLTARDRKIIEHILRYRLTTVEVLRTAVLSGQSLNAVSKIANRLCRKRYLQKFTLLHPVKYFILGDAAVNLFGVDPHRAAPLGPQSLPMEYAVLYYATLGNRLRKRLTAREIRAACPWLPDALADIPHCLDEQQAILELIRVDLGGPADHVARKCLADLRHRSQYRDFYLLAKQQLFRLVIITATPEKAAAVRQALDRHELPSGLLLHFSIIPQLLSLTASRKNA
jgi:hypothetical protein